MSIRPLRRLPLLAVASTTLWLGACAEQNVSQAPPPPPGKDNAAMVAAIRAAGDRDKSVINVHPLVDPGIASLQQGAQADEQGGRFDAAAAKLDMALKRNPESPDVIQDRAELAVYQGNYAMAEQLAQQSYQLGSKQGPLCARNWQTIAELRQHANDGAGAAAADKNVAACREAGIQRY